MPSPGRVCPLTADGCAQQAAAVWWSGTQPYPICDHHMRAVKLVACHKAQIQCLACVDPSLSQLVAKLQADRKGVREMHDLPCQQGALRDQHSKPLGALAGTKQDWSSFKQNKQQEV